MRAIILAAGMGTRLRAVSPSKPLTPIAGQPLLHRILGNLAAAGITVPLVITGYRGDEVAASARAWPGGTAETIHNPAWDQPNGVSVRCAADWLGDGASLLVMADHLASPGLYAQVAASGRADAGLVLGIDRRMGHPWADESDVTRVSTRRGRITAIGKGLGTYDAHDCGVFLITGELMAALGGLAAPGLSDGVRLLAARARAAVTDISAHDWIDIDDARSLSQAEAWVSRAS
ncbi:NTP transferase domain-containing protein [Sandarakinorhabdus sp.]|uniref:phosphocholine cytidylyltransferase family protein n=1 Tax=Sandarakinorhabdus sp. TaxID=1916663 RepID=UPI00286DEA25|nr:NTP transferase domain-containing protein [Sandarakinorhabdus sp.]